MESERPRDASEMSSSRAAAQAHDRINLLLDRIHELTAERDELKRGIMSTLDDAGKIDRLGAALARVEAERDELKQRLESGHVCTPACRPNAHVAFVGRQELDRQLDAARRRAIEEALTEVGNALDGWVEGARSNCEATDHHHGGDEPCGDVFAVEDIRHMIEDARRQLATPDVAVEDGGVTVPVADFVQRAIDGRHAPEDCVSLGTYQQVERERDELKQRLNRATSGWQGAQDERVRQALAERDEAVRVARFYQDVNETLKRQLDEAREQCSRLTRELDDVKAECVHVEIQRDAWKQQANADAAKYADAAGRAERFRRELDDMTTERDEARRWLDNADADRQRATAAVDRERARVDEVATELESALRQRDVAHHIIGNLRDGLMSMVRHLDSLDPNTGQEKAS